MNDNTPSTSPSQPSPCDELRDLLPAYALGALDAAEIARVQQLLKECPEAQTELADYARLSGAIAGRAQPAAPPLALRDKLMAQVSAQEARLAQTVAPAPPLSAVPAKTGSRAWIGWAAAAAALVLLVLTNAYWVNQSNTARSEVELLRAAQEEVFALTSAENLRHSTLASTESGSDNVLANLLWEDNAQTALLTTANLPALPANQTYQLWLIGEDGQPVSAGIFRIDENGIGSLIVNLPDAPQAFQAIAISQEPAGGSEQPTTSPLALGELSAT